MNDQKEHEVIQSGGVQFYVFSRVRIGLLANYHDLEGMVMIVLVSANEINQLIVPVG